MTANTQEILAYLKGLSNVEIAEGSQRFFKIKEGQYGYGDKFLGVRVPVLRKAANLYKETAEDDVIKLLNSEFHEARLLALFIWVTQFSKGREEEKERIFKLYLENTKHINNWDLVDSSAYQIVGVWLEDKDRAVLYQLAKSISLWERRISIMATLHFIKNKDFSDTLKLSTILLNDSEDLIHKAVGWMLREVGNRDRAIEEQFLQQHYKNMPRTMLRYAIEKFSEERRLQYLNARF